MHWDRIRVRISHDGRILERQVFYTISFVHYLADRIDMSPQILKTSPEGFGKETTIHDGSAGKTRSDGHGAHVVDTCCKKCSTPNS